VELIVPIRTDPLLRFMVPNVPVFKIEFVAPLIVPELFIVVSDPPFSVPLYFYCLAFGK
jgi:hypothetical protein